MRYVYYNKIIALMYIILHVVWFVVMCVMCLCLSSARLPLVTSSEEVTAIITMETTVGRVFLGILQEVCVCVCACVRACVCVRYT